MTIRTLVPLITLLLFTAGLAHADIAPPPGYKEKCTVKKVQQRGEECVSCGDAYHGDVEACKRRLEPEGYEFRCQTRGASTWDEVWCRAAADADGRPAGASAGEGAGEGVEPDPVDEVKAKGCAVAAGAAGSPGIVLLMGWWIARRRG